MLGAQEIRQLAAELDIRPTKKLGQNFVIDPNTIHRIVNQAQLSRNDLPVEIGPGLGSLTLGLLAQVPEMVAVEVDDRLGAKLPETIAKHAPGKKLHLVIADALRVKELPKAPTALVANLPYNISVPVMLHFLEQFPSIKKGLVMVQAEVAHRLAAQPGSKDYGAPSLKLAYYGPARLAGNVPRSIFWPVPGVDSALVYFENHREDLSMRKTVFEAIDFGFAQRRKTLRQALAGFAGSPQLAEELLLRAGVAPTARAEVLGIEDFLKIASAK